ncbi:DivIVA domain-containing protein [Lactobacillus agrestimuris]|uniref:DivIVA domain-containing protein n=1 Tax=Lactobacillus agrestimuris TaxID=2941328 RepID=UPI00199D4936|nr:DivIVA domain-containing protein [Lactobacillus agrestimuris]MBD5431554.1 DivIVA domain-containing protein [Lactobacillus sp.]
MDIHNKEFKHRGRNGYDRYEVDSFLDQIVDDYGDSLDEVVDLKNQMASLNDKVTELQAKVNKYEQKESEVNQALVSAQQTANKIIADAKAEAEKSVKDAKDQSMTDTNYQRQQQDVLKYDYDRLKKEIGEFRTNMQAMLQKEIDNLSDDQWQHALDKYFKTPRFYPEDGSEPVPTAETQEEEFAREARLADEFTDDLDENDYELVDDDVDIDDDDEVDSSEEVVEADDDSEPQPMTGDSSNHETINTEAPARKDTGVNIVFPDDYKDHN